MGIGLSSLKKYGKFTIIKIFSVPAIIFNQLISEVVKTVIDNWNKSIVSIYIYM